MKNDTTLPERLSIGIVHLGLGAFFRAHQAVFTEQAMLEAGGQWGICAVAMRSRDLAERLRASDGRYALIEQQPSGPRVREFSVIREVLCLPDEPQAVIARLADAAVHVVTITVTEKGYCFHGKQRELNLDDPSIRHDLADPSRARSMPGILVAGLQERRRQGGSGVSILSCDNLPANGQLLRQILLSYAMRVDPELAAWIEAQCRFPASMVDRITPAATDATRALAAQLLGREDPAALETEPFNQWVIENDFAGPRPAWEQAGVQLVSDVEPFEDMKLRMLNGAHSLIAYLGAVVGLPAVRDVMQETVCRNLVRQHMDSAARTLSNLSDEQCAAYRDRLIERFENTAIDHRCLQIAMDGSQKMPQRIFTPAAQLLDSGDNVDSYALATALWFRYLQGRNERGETIECNDPLKQELLQIVQAEESLATRVARLGELPGVPAGVFDHAGWVLRVSQLIEAIEHKDAISVTSELIKRR